MKTPIFLDNNSTTPLDPEVFETMRPYFMDKFGNSASRDHSFGWEAESAVEFARRNIAALIGSEPSEIVFTSGATEAINIVLFGVSESDSQKKHHIVTSVIEHSAVLDSLKELEKKGFKITYLPVDRSGMLNVEVLKESISQDTLLVSVMHANNEIGIINNIKEIGRTCREKNVFFHTDAAQSLGKIPFDVKECNIDFAAFSAHKIYGPKGIGALFIRNKIKLRPRTFGGGHERGLRPGTLNVPAIAGFGKAASICKTNIDRESKYVGSLRDKLYKEICSNLNDVIVNGTMDYRLPNNLNLCFKDVKSENLLLEMREIAVSTGAACTTASLKPSHVLKAIGLNDQDVRSSIRFSPGRFNTEEEINYTIQKVIDSVHKVKSYSPINRLREKNEPKS